MTLTPVRDVPVAASVHTTALVAIVLALGGLGWIGLLRISGAARGDRGTHVARRVIGSLS